MRADKILNEISMDFDNGEVPMCSHCYQERKKSSTKGLLARALTTKEREQKSLRCVAYLDPNHKHKCGMDADYMVRSK